MKLGFPRFFYMFFGNINVKVRIGNLRKGHFVIALKSDCIND